MKCVTSYYVLHSLYSMVWYVNSSPCENVHCTTISYNAMYVTTWSITLWCMSTVWIHTPRKYLYQIGVRPPSYSVFVHPASESYVHYQRVYILSRNELETSANQPMDALVLPQVHHHQTKIVFVFVFVFSFVFVFVWSLIEDEICNQLWAQVSPDHDCICIFICICICIHIFLDWGWDR